MEDCLNIFLYSLFNNFDFVKIKAFYFSSLKDHDLIEINKLMCFCCLLKYYSYFIFNLHHIMKKSYHFDIFDACCLMGYLFKFINNSDN